MIVEEVGELLLAGHEERGVLQLALARDLGKRDGELGESLQQPLGVDRHPDHDDSRTVGP